VSDPLDHMFFDAAPPQQRGPRPMLRFFSEPVELPGKSAEEGRPVYVERDFVGITNPGSRDEVVRRAEEKAKEDEFIGWAYAKWKKTQEQVTDGTPLETVPFLNKSQVLELKALAIHSLENLALAPDTAMQRMMGLRDLRKKAEAYMSAAKDTAMVTRLQTELSQRDQTIERLQKQMEQMSARFDAITSKMESAA
jgi:hypothetical protein